MAMRDHILAEIAEDSHESMLSEFPEFIHPHYGKYCISNVQRTVLRSLGFGGREGIEEPDFRPSTVVLLVVDALGYNLLSGLGFEQAMPITSVFPSTSAAALTSINRGLPPIGHGIPGFMMNVLEAGGICKTVSFSRYLDKEEGTLLHGKVPLEPESLLLTKETPLFRQLERKGVAVTEILRKEYIGKPFERILHGDGASARKIPYLYSSDMAVSLRKAIESAKGGPAYINAYWDAVDELSHLYGPKSPEVAAEVSKLFFLLKRELSKLSLSARRRTLFMMVADHGQHAISPKNKLYVSDDKVISDALLLPPSGDSRAAHLYLKQGEVERVKKYLQGNGRIARNFAIFESREALKGGLFGPVAGKPSAEFERRIGDLLLVARTDGTVGLSERSDFKHIKRGTHASLTPDEMLVPFLFGRIDKVGLF